MDRLYSIGDVHEMTGISVSALRYYADMKIVCPAKIDRHTGYRYYDFDDIQRLKTVGYLKKAGFSLAEITAVMEAGSDEERSLLMSERLRQTEKQMKRLEEKMAMMEWLTSQNPVPEEGHESYRIHQKQMDSRRVWMTETPKACGVEEFYRQTGALMAEEMTDFQKMRGYILEEGAFMEAKQLAIEGSFISAGDGMPIGMNTDTARAGEKLRTAGHESGEHNQSILPKGNYICMITAIFRDDKWIRALSRYFTEKDMRPRIILAVLKHKDFYNWRHSLYEVQILV